MRDFDTELVASQGTYLKQKVEALGFSSIKINPTPVFREADSFVDKKTLAYSSLSELPLAIVSSIGSKRFARAPYPVTAMLIPPERESSGLLIDEKTKSLYTDAFWTCEEGELKFIKAAGPVPIDGWDVAFDLDREDPDLESYQRPHKALHEITDDKYRTREILEEAGVRIPNGVLLRSAQEARVAIKRFIDGNPQAQGLVVKLLHGAQGDNVSLFSLDEAEGLIEALERNLGEKVLIEERIVPPPPAQRLRSITAFHGISNPDYNFRVITSLGRDNPVVIDSEIRFGEFSDRPVNVSKGAKAARMNTLGDLDLTRNVCDAGRRAIGAVCRQALAPGEQMLGIGGGDLILDQSGNVYVMEVNSGLVGGFGTLSRFDGKPLSKIRDVLIPSYAPYIEDQFSKRTVELPKTLRRLPLSEIDRLSLFNFYITGENYQEAEQLLLHLGESFDDPTSIALNLIRIGDKLGRRDVAFTYILRALQSSPRNSSLLSLKAKLLRESGQLEKAKETLDAVLKKDAMSVEVLWEQFLAMAELGKGEEASKVAKKLLEQGESMKAGGLEKLMEVGRKRASARNSLSLYKFSART